MLQRTIRTRTTSILAGMSLAALAMGTATPVNAATPAAAKTPGGITDVTFVDGGAVDGTGRKLPTTTTVSEYEVVKNGVKEKVRTTVIGVGKKTPLVSTQATNGGCDGYAIYQCITMHYTEVYEGATQFTSLTKYTATWTRTDPSLRTVKGSIRAAVYGQRRGDRQMVSANTVRAWTYPTNGATYTYTPSWAGTYTITNVGNQYQCGNASAIYDRNAGTDQGPVYSPNACRGGGAIPFP